MLPLDAIGRPATSTGMRRGRCGVLTVMWDGRRGAARLHGRRLQDAVSVGAAPPHGPASPAPPLRRSQDAGAVQPRLGGNEIAVTSGACALSFSPMFPAIRNRRCRRSRGGMEGSPIVTQDGEQPGREHDVAVLAAPALVDANDLTPAVHVGRAQTRGSGGLPRDWRRREVCGAAWGREGTARGPIPAGG